MKDERGRRAIRASDTTSHGGIIMTTSGPSAYPDGALARAGDMIYCPKCMAYTYIEHEGSFWMNQPFAVEGQLTTCGAVLVCGPPPRREDDENSFAVRTGGSAAPLAYSYEAPSSYRRMEKDVWTEPEEGSLRIHLVDAGYGHISRHYPRMTDGGDGPELEYSLTAAGQEVRWVYVNAGKSMLNVPAGPAVLRLASNQQDLHRVLEHLHPPRYSAEDIRTDNGLPKSGGRSAQEEGFVVHGRDDLNWKSKARLTAEKKGFNYIRVRYLPPGEESEHWEFEIDGKRMKEFEVELTVTANKHTTYVIEVDGRYARIPALRYCRDLHTVNAYNLCGLGHLSYGEFDLTEDRRREGSTEDVFTKYNNYEPVEYLNGTYIPPVHLCVPYAHRFTEVQVFTDDVTGLRALCASNYDTVILAFSGLNRPCYDGKEARELEKAWLAALRGQSLPFAGRHHKADDVRKQLLRYDAPVVGVAAKVYDLNNDILYRNDKDDLRPLTINSLPRVHYGVYQAFSGLQREVYEFLKTNNLGGRKKLYVSGSCMGAAVASLFLADMKPEEGGNPIFYSFGMPRMLSHELVKTLEAKNITHFNIGVMGDVLQAAPFTNQHLAGLRLAKGLVGFLSPNVVSKAFGVYNAVHALEEEDYYAWGRPARLMYHEAEVMPRRNGKFNRPARNIHGPLRCTDSALARHFDFFSQFSLFDGEEYGERLGQAFDASSRRSFFYCYALEYEMLTNFRAVRGDTGNRQASHDGYVNFLYGVRGYIDNEIDQLNKILENSYRTDMNGERHMHTDARYIVSPVRDEYLSLKNGLNEHIKALEAEGDIPVNALEAGLTFADDNYAAQVRQQLKSRVPPNDTEEESA